MKACILWLLFFPAIGLVTADLLEGELNLTIDHVTKSEEKESISWGGRPAKAPVFGKKVCIYDENDEIKVDSEGRAYLGLSIEEVKALEIKK